MIYRKPGYILIFSLMMISLCVVLVTTLVDRGDIFLPLVRTYQQRQQAYLLAFSGVQIAKSQLQVMPKQEQEKAAQDGQLKAPDEKTRTLALLQKIVPVLNRWQTFDLTQEKDGVDGQIKICIMSENGKLDVNALYDFEKKQFAQGSETYKKVIQELFTIIEKQTKSHNMLQALEAYLKNRGYPLDDPTQLLTIKEFEVFKNTVFYEPQVQKKDETEKTPLYLTDIFTLWTGQNTIEPWFFSSSMLALLGLQITPDSKKMAAAFKAFALEAQWPTTWNNSFAQLYQKEFTALPKNIDNVFSKKCEPTIFSVLSHGTFGGITQRLFAIVERVEKKSDKGHVSYEVVLRKLYWL